MGLAERARTAARTLRRRLGEPAAVRREPNVADPWYDLFPFTTHRLRVGGDLWTMDGGVDVAIDGRTQLVVDEAGGLDGRSVVDLGCLEGGFTLELARRGASRAVGIEFRDVSVRRCEIARDLIGLPHAEFVCGDIERELPNAGEFDVVFAAGILYHLDRPAEMLTLIRTACTGFALIDTHVATRDVVTHDCGPETTITSAAGERYEGRWFREFPDDATAEQRSTLLWASGENPRSFWPFEDELVRMITDAGFSEARKVTFPPDVPWHVDQTNRVLYICRA